MSYPPLSVCVSIYQSVRPSAFPSFGMTPKLRDFAVSRQKIWILKILLDVECQLQKGGLLLTSFSLEFQIKGRLKKKDKKIPSSEFLIIWQKFCIHNLRIIYHSIEKRGKINIF